MEGLLAQINDKTYFNFNATYVNNSQIDTLAELQNYDVVFLGGSGDALDVNQITSPVCFLF